MGLQAKEKGLEYQENRGENFFEISSPDQACEVAQHHVRYHYRYGFK